MERINCKMGRFFHIGSLNFKKGFTIVELLIVVVVIGILAAITIVSFGGITGQANQASLQSDLDSNSRKLQLYYTQYGSYPTNLDGSNCPTAPTADTNYCLKPTAGTTLTYQGSSIDYSLYATKGTNIYKVTPSAPPFSTKLASVCPTGFIVVPGSSTYGTNDFCVMKFEAKCASSSSLTVGLLTPTTGSNTYDNNSSACTAANTKNVVSTASGYPIANVSQSTSSTIASNVSGCVGCALINEAQWMTIAQNVASNPVNWSGNAVGSGYIFSGHNDSTPNNALIAGDDSDGYLGTSSTSGNQKRTLRLTNGEIIWDFAGNVLEWTSAQQTGNQPSPTGWSYREWTSVSGGTFSVNPYPSGSGISGSSAWTSTNGIGRIYSNSSDATLRGFYRGGWWNDGNYAGIYYLFLGDAPTVAYSSLGFRVAR